MEKRQRLATKTSDKTEGTLKKGGKKHAHKAKTVEKTAKTESLKQEKPEVQKETYNNFFDQILGRKRFL